MTDTIPSPPAPLRDHEVTTQVHSDGAWYASCRCGWSSAPCPTDTVAMVSAGNHHVAVANQGYGQGIKIRGLAIRGWIVDILVGWLMGSIVGGLVFAFIDVLAAANGRLAPLGVVAGTAGGVAWMRRHRARREPLSAARIGLSKAALAILVVTVAVAGVVGALMMRDEEPSGQEQAVGATSPLSAEDERLVDGLGEHSSRWNEAAGPFVRDYLDPNVSAAEWVAAADAQVAEMRNAVISFQTDVMAISDPGVRSVFEEFTDNYRAKLDAVTRLWNAVAAGDPDAEEAAGAELQAAAEEGQQLATSLLDKLRRFVDPEDLTSLLQDRAADLQHQLGS